MSKLLDRRDAPDHARIENRLLEHLSDEDYSLLAPELICKSVKLKSLLIQAGEPIRDIFFPTTALISTLVVMEDGNEVETAITGAEGMVGLTAALGLDVDLHRAICQVPGDIYRISVNAFREVLARSRSLDILIKKYTTVVLRQTAQVVACNALHPATERMCRWLLMSQDRVHRDEFPMTQEFMAELLGVRRQTVTVVAGTLQAAGLINITRGRVRILDRSKLEDASCECYRLIKALYEHVFP
jgi:CRP-like cAMP-binding protein